MNGSSRITQRALCDCTSKINTKRSCELITHHWRCVRFSRQLSWINYTRFQLFVPVQPGLEVVQLSNDVARASLRFHVHEKPISLTKQDYCRSLVQIHVVYIPGNWLLWVDEAAALHNLRVTPLVPRVPEQLKWGIAKKPSNGASYRRATLGLSQYHTRQHPSWTFLSGRVTLRG